MALRSRGSISDACFYIDFCLAPAAAVGVCDKKHGQARSQFSCDDDGCITLHDGMCRRPFCLYSCANAHSARLYICMRAGRERNSNVSHNARECGKNCTSAVPENDFPQK